MTPRFSIRGLLVLTAFVGLLVGAALQLRGQRRYYEALLAKERDAAAAMDARHALFRAQAAFRDRLESLEQHNERVRRQLRIPESP